LGAVEHPAKTTALTKTEKYFMKTNFKIPTTT